MRLVRSAIAGATLAFAAACASAGSTSESESATRRDRNLLTEEEIVAAKSTDAYSAIRSTRPGWLLPKVVTARRMTPAVYVDGNNAGSINVLSQYNVAIIKEIRYLSPEDATTRFGTGHGAGAIVLTLKR